MHFLGSDFIISSILWLLVIFIFMFIFRKHIFKFYYKESDLDKFLIILEQYLKKTYPKLNLNFHFLKTLENEPNPDAVKYALLDNIINQYISLDFNPSSTKAIPSNKLWGSYAFNSQPDNNKLPDDWQQRKALVFERDEKICQRCSKKITIKDADIIIIIPIQKGGQYYFENLLLLCTDCIKIENNKRDNSKNIKYLNIKNELYSLVK